MRCRGLHWGGQYTNRRLRRNQNQTACSTRPRSTATTRRGSPRRSCDGTGIAIRAATTKSGHLRRNVVTRPAATNTPACFARAHCAPACWCEVTEGRFAEDRTAEVPVAEKQDIYERPILDTRSCRTRCSRLRIGKLKNRLLRHSITRNASSKALGLHISGPTTTAGPSTPQCAVIGWPAQIGQPRQRPCRRP